MIARVVTALLMIALSSCAQPQHRAAIAEPWYPATNDQGDPLFAVFDGRIPCTRPDLSGCEKIKVSLALYQDRQSNAPKTYQLARVYVATHPEGDRLVVAGNLKITRGTKLDANAIVYQLDANAPREFRAYWAIGQSILFMLDEALNPRVGTAAWSYVLNRTR